MQADGKITAGPHLCSGESGRRILWTYVGALWLVVMVSAAFFGWSSLIVLAGSVGTCVAVDLAMCRLAGSRNPASLPHAVLTGLLLGLTLPVMGELNVMLQITVVGAVALLRATEQCSEVPFPRRGVGDGHSGRCGFQAGTHDRRRPL